MARVQILAAALLFATGGAAIKLSGLSGWQIACFRSAVATAVLWAAFPHWRGLRDARVWTVGCAYGATLVLYAIANTLTTAAAAIFLQSSAMLYVLIAAPRALGEARRPGDLPVVALIAAGVAAVFAGTDAPLGTAPDPRAGNWIGAASGVTWAATLLGLRWLGRDALREPPATGDPTGASVIAGNALAFAVGAPFAFPVASASAVDWLVVGYLGAFQIGLAYVLVVRGVRHLRAIEFSLLLLLEPVANGLLAWWVHGEAPTPLALAGSAMILAGVAGQALRQPAA